MKRQRRARRSARAARAAASKRRSGAGLSARARVPGQLRSRFQGFSWSAAAAARPLTPAGSEEGGLAPHGRRAGTPSGGCASSPTRRGSIASPFWGDNERQPFPARALLLLLSLTPPPLLSAPPLAPTGAAFADSRTKGNCSWRRVRCGAEGAHLLRGVWRGGGGGGAMAQSSPLASRAPWKPFESEAWSHLEPRLDLRPSRVPSSAGRSRRDGPV